MALRFIHKAPAKRRVQFLVGACILAGCLTLSVSADQAIYTDSLQNGWQNWSWANVDFSHNGTVHSGNRSIRVEAQSWQAVSLWHSAQDASPFSSLSFWIHGGSSGGQPLQVYAETDSGGGQPSVAIPSPIAGTWQQVTIPLADLGVEGASDMTRFSIQLASASAYPAFYVDEVRLTTDTSPPTVENVSPAAGTVASLQTIIVTFSEPVTGINASDLHLNGTPAAALSGDAASYNFTVPALPEGIINITWDPAHSITDLAATPNAFNGTGPGATWQYTLTDTVSPLESLIFPAAGASVASLQQVEVTFDETVMGVDATDLLINGSPATTLTKLSGQPYVFSFPEPATGLVSMAWAPAHGITDTSTSPNPFAGGTWNYTLDPNQPVSDLVITEILASNVDTDGLIDADGQIQDWIEIFNQGTQPVNLTNWSLSDDPALPGLWPLPARTLNAGEYLVIFASGKDRKPMSGELHTNFKLSRSGEHLGLYTPDSPRIMASGFVEYPEQRNDTSYGTDTFGQLRYFATPTPGTANGTSSIIGVVTPLHVNVERGHFSHPFHLILSCDTPAATYRYTTDGSEPTASSPVFPGSLTVSDTTLFRAAGFKVDHLPSRTLTHSYLFGLPESFRSLPVVSIVTDSNNLWGATGIMGYEEDEHGTVLYKNVLNHGLAWERPTSVEWIEPEDHGGFQVDCGIRIQGSDYNRENSPPDAKRSFRLYFRGDYGPGRLEYPLFPLTTVERFDGLVLRAGFNEQGNPFIRDELVRRLSSDMGQIASHGNIAVVLINGSYYAGSPWYNPCERIHEEFFQEHLGGGDEWDVVKPRWQNPNYVDGSGEDFENMINWVDYSADLSVSSQYITMSERLEITNFVDYLVLNTYTGTDDWPGNNWRAGRDQRPGGIWRFAVWDAEQSFGIYGRQPNGPDAVNRFPDLPGSWTPIPTLYANLMDSPEFRLLWADRVQKHFYNGGILTETHLLSRLYELQQELSILMPDMDPSIEYWIQNRENTYFDQLENEGLLAPIEAPTFNQHGGRIPAGFTLAMTAPAGTIYYTTDGTDPRVVFSGNVSGSATSYSSPVPLSAGVRVLARARSGSTWSALSDATFTYASLGVPLRITEIMYNPVGGSIYEFVELENTSASDLDLSGMYFDGIGFTFLEGSTLTAGTRLVLGSNTDTNAWNARYGSGTAFGWFGGNLSNGGERLALYDAQGHIITSVDYNDGGGWPEGADGPGSSLEMLNPTGDPDDPANWQASAAVDGTPGSVNSAPPATAVYLNEVMAENVSAVNHGGTHPDWVELRNESGSPMDVGGWSLTDDGNERKFVFPGGTTVPATGYLVIWCDAATNTTPGLHTDFSLDNDGETVSLYNATTTRVDAVTYGLQIADLTVGRIGGDWTLNSPTPNGANTAAALGAASNLAINEWMADPVPGDDDWLEIYNGSATLPVSLAGLYLATSNELSRLAALSYLAPTTHVRIWADEGVGVDHVDFRLPAAGNRLTLYDATGDEVDQLVYGLQVEGISEGRLPDGDPTVMSFPGSASPGSLNYVSAYSGPVINEILARNSLFDVGGGVIVDYVEIHNPDGSSFDLGGMSLSVNKAEAGTWIFPPATVLGANQYLLIPCDGSQPVSTNPGSFNLGSSLDGESGGAYLFNPAQQRVDAVEYGLQVRNQSIGLDGGVWKLLDAPTPGTANAAPAALGANTSLVINEWMANPNGGADWFELYNPLPLPVDLSTISLSDDPSVVGEAKFLPQSLSFIGPGGYVKWVADASPGEGRNHVNFSLDGGGDYLLVYADQGGGSFSLIDAAAFGGQTEGVSIGDLPDGSGLETAFPGSASPAASNYRLLTDILINEILTHTDPPYEDAVELHNPTAAPIDVGGWYLSNSRDDRTKFQIPTGVTIPAGGFFAIYEYQFNAGGPDAFGLNSAHGDEIWLSKAPGGIESGDRVFAQVGAALNGVAFGRVATSDSVDYTAVTHPTFGVTSPASLAAFRTGAGAANASPVVGPVIVNEILYHPPGGAGGSDEYVELFNNSGSAVNLFDPAYPSNRWKLGGGIEYAFPTGVSLAAGAYLLVVDFDPALDPAALAAFRTRYDISTGVPVYGPFSGNLDNAGDEVVLYRPDTPQQPPSADAGFVPYVVADRVAYDDAAPWPAGSVDGGGDSLQRAVPWLYGNEPLYWIGATPTPGKADTNPQVDTDGDGIPDYAELAMGLEPDNAADGAEDADGDYVSNYHEYLAGTDHLDPASYLRLLGIVTDSDVVLSFEAVAAKSYSVLYKDDLTDPDWSKLKDVAAPVSTRIENVTDGTSSSKRFYIIVTPAMP